MIAEVLATGDEIRSGALIDSNSAYIAEKLEEVGVAVMRHTCVGDDLGSLVTCFNEIGDRVDIAVVTGGLGPTSDDLTAQAAATSAGVKLAFNSSALQSVENFFKTHRRTMNPASRKQALLPEGAACLNNPVGSAPGFVLRIGKCMFFFLPGVPQEMKKMLADEVLPRITHLQKSDRKLYRVKTLATFGLTESITSERIAEFEDNFAGIKLGLRVKFPEVQVKLYASGTNQILLDQQLDAASEWIAKKIGNKLVSFEGDPMQKVVGDLLREKKEILALAESCTGGLISHMLTNIAGSSDYFVFSGISYSNKAKIDILGVSPDTIETYGAVHEQTAKEMALGAQHIAGATYGLSTSGIAGPGGGTKAKPVGTICIGLATPSGASGHRFNFWYDSRSMNKKIFAVTALDLLRRELLGLELSGPF
jgi:nicotinamide-nucleotide amidase